MSILDRVRNLERKDLSTVYGGRTGPVKASSDLERVLALPRRPVPTEAEQARMAAEMTRRLRRDNPGCICAKINEQAIKLGRSPCITELNNTQGWYLYEFDTAGGAFGMIEVGGGKTGIDILLAMVAQGVSLAVLLIPSDGAKQFARDFVLWSQHFMVPNLVGGDPKAFVAGRPRLEILPYSLLRRPEYALWLKEREGRINLWIGDEIQALKALTSVQSDRFMRAAIDNEAHARAGFHSGSATTREVSDFAHLVAVVFKERSPMPVDPATVEEWGNVLNPGKTSLLPIDAGELKKLCENGESPRAAMSRRLLETPGMIATTATNVTAVLRMREWPADVPDEITVMMRRVRKEEERPDGEVLTDELEISATLTQLACGFYYKWFYPRGESPELIDEWFGKRQAWARELRGRMEHRTDGLDSPALLWEAAERAHLGYKGPLPIWKTKHWPAWVEIKDQVVPEPRPVWVSDFLIERSIAWAKQGPGIIWYRYDALGERLARLSGLELFGGGADLGAHTPGDRAIIASIPAHHKVKNLQQFWRMLVTNLPADGGIWDQMVGRCHRAYQPKDEVHCYVFRHTLEVRKALADARSRAKYQHELTRAPHRLLMARYEGFAPDSP